MFRSFILLLFPILLSAQCVIDADHYAIDESKKLIIINKNLDHLNTDILGIKTYLNIEGDIYNFALPVNILEKGTPYIASKNNIDYTVFFSELPIIRMTTSGEIKDTPKTLGNFELLVSDEEKTTSLIGVEYRGASSQSYPKKSMEIEFWLDENGNETQDLSILNLFEEDAINLQAMYNEKLRANSKTANELWQEIHPDVYYKNNEPDARSGILMKYTDLFLNGEYRGVYAFGEKVKRKFLKLKKNSESEIKGELYKGHNYGPATMFTGIIPYNNSTAYWGGWEYKYPKDVIDWENIYQFTDFVINSDEETFYNFYSQKIDVENIIDYFIFVNILRAADNLSKNTYLAKNKQDDPFFYIPWDLDGTFGGWWDGSNQNIYNDLLFNGLYARLWQNDHFRELLHNRWTTLRNSIITKEHIIELFSNNFLKLKSNGIYTREEMVWNDYTFPEDQLQYHKTWIQNRIEYLDTQFGYSLGTPQPDGFKNSLAIYPNPTSSYFSVNISSPLKNAEIKIIDFSGKELQKTNVENLDKTTKISISGLSSGVYFVILKTKENIQTSRLVIKK